jgi:branched-chain amino acid transport system substrate-binding protein
LWNRKSHIHKYKDPKENGKGGLKMKRMLLVGLVVVGALLVLGLSPAGAQTKEISIGAVFPLSGPLAPIGQHIRVGIDIAIEEINQAGGIKSLGGAKLKMIYGDSTGDAKVGVTEMEKLISKDKVAVVTGAYQSGVTLPMTTVSERYGIPFYATGSEDQITERGYKYTFRSNEKTSWRVRDQVRFISDTGKRFRDPVKTAGLVWENTAWGQGAHRDWLKYLGNENVKIVVDESYPNATTDLTPVVLKLKGANPDGIFYCSYISDAILLVKTIAEMEVNAKAVVGLSGGTADPNFIPGVGKNCLYTFDAVRWEPDILRPGVKELCEKFKKRAGVDLDTEVMKQYTYMYVIAEAINKAASTDPKKIRDALASLRIKGPHPAIKFVEDEFYFDETGQVFQGNMVGVQFREIDGKIQRVTIWPEKVARKGIEAVWPMPKWSERKK